MENLLLKVAPKEEIDKKLENVFETLFGQESPERIYFEEMIWHILWIRAMMMSEPKECLMG
ncbi:hypothetical protein [Lactococcus lactis]|uniref:hypothetical protein n=1 Tax=Lactococcus lactis TaxID=1358 RepID=UPI001F085C3B|nr:hypothetical protein [Lactococcus lactis]